VPELGSIATFFAVLLSVGLLVLAIAGANVAGLLLARSSARQRELAIRVALGASRRRLMQQVLAESFWLALAGTAGGLLLTFGAMRAISSLPLPLPLPLEIGTPFDLGLFGCALAVVLLATLFGGLLPAIQATRPSVAPALKQDVRRYVHRRWTLRGLLVIGQVAVSILLVVTSFLFLRNLARAHALDPGFDTTSTLVAQVGFVEHRYTAETRTALLATAVDRVEALPRVERATYALGVPLTIRSGRVSGAPVSIEGEGARSNFDAMWAENMVGPGYFDKLGIALLKGRDFTSADTAGAPRVIVINEAFVRRHLGGREPIGLRLLLPGAASPDAYEIVGVVGNSRHRTIGEGQMAAVYYSYAQRPGDGRVVHLLARMRGAPEDGLASIAGAIEGLDPTAAVDVQTMRHTLAFAFLPSRVGAALVGGLGAVALTLAMAGLFALLSYSVTRRTKEIGVRMALGAPVGAVARLVIGDALTLVATGMAIGLALAAFVTQPLAMFLVDGLRPGDPVSFAGTALIFVLVSAAATWQPIRRAAGVDPVAALRDE
jgi:predicted permease